MEKIIKLISELNSVEKKIMEKEEKSVLKI